MVSPETLRRYPLFAKQSHYMLKEIARLSTEVEVEAGDWLFHERDEATRLYLVLDGSVAQTIYLYLNGQGQHIEATSSLGKGDIAGWPALINSQINTLGAQAEEKSRLLAIDAVPLRELLDDNPTYGYYLMKNLAEVLGERLTCKCIQLLSIVLDSKGNLMRNNIR
jgi:CRP-like cAMP-binding protein